MSVCAALFPLIVTFNLYDGRPEWPEMVLAVGAALIGAYFVAAVVGRVFRWALRGPLGADARPQRQSVDRPVLIARIVIFLLTWVALTVPLLDGIGLPLEVNLSRRALLHWLLASGLRVVLIVLISWLVVRISRSAAERIERELARGASLDVIERTRRAQTLGRLVQNVLAVLVSAIALLMILRELGVDIMPMVTGAGIVGVALGFGAQYLVRDIIAGFFLIYENQVRVGDVAAINGVGGLIEEVNLRTTVLRDNEGAVHVFQNGAINALANRSKDYAYYVLDVNVPYGQDTDRVTVTLRQVGQDMVGDPQFRDKILAPLEIMGVDAFLDTRVTIKTRIKTLPLKQWEVGRELRRRTLIALEQNGVELQPPVTWVVRNEPRETAALPPDLPDDAHQA
jgi:small-conductance mechanosensitive channel